MSNVAARTAVTVRRLARPLAPTLRRVPGARVLAERLADRAKGPVAVRTRRKFTVWVDPRDVVVGRTLMADGQFEPGIAAFIESQLAPGETAVDVGANVGYYTGVMAVAVGPGGRVLALEPAPANFDLLDRTVSSNGWTQVDHRKLAAGAEPGELELFLDPFNWGNHSFAAEVTTNSVRVPIAPLDVVESFDGVRLVKIDVQGWEAHVLAGATRLLAGKPILVMEFHPEMLERAGSDPAVVLADLFADAERIHILDGEAGTLASVSGAAAVMAACDAARWKQVDLVVDYGGTLR